MSKWLPLILILFFTGLVWQSKAQDQTCLYLIDLQAPAGNGLNGAFLEVIAESDTSTFTLQSGNQRFIELPIPNGEEFRILLNPGLLGFDNTAYAIVNSFDPNAIEPVEVFNDRVDFLSVIRAIGPASCATCQAVIPPLVNIDRIRASTADVNWGELPQAESYLVEYGETGFLPDSGIVEQVVDNSIRLMGLIPKTQYDVYLSAVCAAGDTSERRGPFTFESRFEQDAGVASVDIPTADCALEASSLPLQVQVANFGSTPQSLVRLGFSVNGDPVAIDYPRDGVYTGIIGSGQSDEFQFDAQISLAEGPGDYEIQIWTFLDGDEDLTNDTLTYIYTLQTRIDSFPYRENLDSTSRILGIETTSQSASWQFGTLEGPRFLKEPSSENSWFSVREAGQEGEPELSFLRFPCLDLSEFEEDPLLSFAFRIASSNTSGFNSAWVEYSLDGGANWDRLGVQGTGLNWYNGSFVEPGAAIWSPDFNGQDFSTVWTTVIHPLAGLAGADDVKLRLAYQTLDEPADYDILLDNLQVYGQAENDLTAIEAERISSVFLCEENQIEHSVRFEFANIGTLAQSDILVGFAINDDPGGVVALDPASLGPNETAERTLPILTPNEPGSYQIRLWVSGEEDNNFLNDTLTINFDIPDPSVPFKEDFENLEFVELPVGWRLSQSSSIEAPFSGSTKVLAYTPIPPAAEVQYTTPLIGPLGVSDSLLFDLFLNFVPEDDFSILVTASSDCFASSVVVEEFEATDLQEVFTFFTSSSSLADLAGEDVQFRFRFSSPSLGTVGNFFLDNVSVIGCQADFNPQVEIVDASSPSANDGSITVTPTTGVGPFSFEWNTGDTTSSINNLAPGSYSVLIQDSTGCSQMVLAEVDVVTSTQELSSAIESVTLMPNPTGSTTQLIANFDKAVQVDWQLFNINGQLLQQSGSPILVSRLNEQVDLNSYSPGVYLLKLRVENQIQTLRIVRTGF